MSSFSTLHQLLSTPHCWGNTLQLIQLAWQPGDVLVLLGEAAQGHSQERLKRFAPVYLLQADADVLGLKNDLLFAHIINYAEWADLVLQYDKHISWK